MNEPTPLNDWVTAHYDGLRMAGFIVAAIALVWAAIAIVSVLVPVALLGLDPLALGAIRRDQPALDSALSET